MSGRGQIRTGRALAFAACALLAACARPDESIPVGAAAYQVVPAPVSESVRREYRIGPLDTLSVTVFQEPDLSFATIPVDASGNLVLPLAGIVRAADRTAAELSTDIARKLDPYLINPQVTVSVTNSVSQKVTVDGSVEQPGVYTIQGRTTLIDALAMARGTNRVAALDQVIVFREIDGRPAAARFNVADIRMGRQPNPEILGNDVVVVGFSNVKGVYRDIVASASLFASFSYLISR